MKLLVSVAAVAMALSVFTGSAAAKDGTYTSTTLGRNGDVTVQVTIDKDKITDIKISEWSETHPVADLPKQKVPADIIANQSTNVNNISGATLTTFAIKAAVQDCLKQAGLDPKNFSQKVPEPEKIAKHFEEEADVIVVGAGGAGLSAAVAAAEKGASVIVVEKTHFAGGNTSVAGGCYNSADPDRQAVIKMTEGQMKAVENLLAETPKNDLQAKLIAQVKEQFEAYKKSGSTSLFDSPELHALQSWKAGDYKGDLPLVYKLTQEAPKMRQFLAGIGFKWQDKPSQVVGALWPRSNRASNYKSGVGYIDTFLDLIKKNNYPVTFLYSTKAEELIMQDGKAIGVKAVGAQGQTYDLIGKKGIVIASGGFSANVGMRNKYDEIWGKTLDEKVKTTNLPSITGEVLEFVVGSGAQLKDMGYIQLLPTTDPATGATNHKITETTNIFVNKLGNRFVNEQERRDVLSKAALAQPDHIFYLIGAEDTLNIDKDGRSRWGVLLTDLIKQKKAYKGDSFEDLAKQIGMNPDNLKKTVEKWNEFCKTQKNDEFGRLSCEDGNRLPGPPYYATPVTVAVHHTMGGIRITPKAEVLDKDGKVIPGLYAAGEVTGGIHGTNRVGCNAVPDALVFGRIAGQSVASK